MMRSFSGIPRTVAPLSQRNGGAIAARPHSRENGGGNRPRRVPIREIPSRIGTRGQGTGETWRRVGRACPPSPVPRPLSPVPCPPSPVPSSNALVLFQALIQRAAGDAEADGGALDVAVLLPHHAQDVKALDLGE